MSGEEPDVKVSPRPICPSTWGHLKGYIQVRDPFSGEVVEIPHPQATDVWKHDIRQLRNRG